MSTHRWVLALFCALLLYSSPSPRIAMAADDKAATKPGKVAGILIEKSDDSIMVKADGEDEPVKYLISKTDKKLARSLKTVFDAGRVQLTYKTDGDSRQLLTIKKQVLRSAGKVTGVVVKVYNDFWVEVKPKTGVNDAYAPSAANFKNKAFMEKLKGLSPGDSVTIQFTTDSERHRIVTLRKN